LDELRIQHTASYHPVLNSAKSLNPVFKLMMWLFGLPSSIHLYCGWGAFARSLQTNFSEHPPTYTELPRQM